MSVITPSEYPIVTQNTVARVCPHCGSTFVLRTKRPWYQKLVHSQEGLFKCHDCGKKSWVKLQASDL